MRRAALLPLLLLPLTLALPLAAAQEANETVTDVDLAPWIHDWDLREAGLLAAVAAVAALVVLYPLVGGTMPGTVGATDLQLEKMELEEHEAQIAQWAGVQVKALDRIPPDKIAYLDAALIQYVIAKRRAYNRSAATHFLLASVIFLVTGVGGALLLAQDLLQAALIGAGGPALVGQLIAKKENRKKLSFQNRAIEAMGGPPANDEEEPRLRFAGRF